MSQHETTALYTLKKSDDPDKRIINCVLSFYLSFLYTENVSKWIMNLNDLLHDAACIQICNNISDTSKW